MGSVRALRLVVGTLVALAAAATVLLGAFIISRYVASGEGEPASPYWIVGVVCIVLGVAVGTISVSIIARRSN